MRRRTPRLRQKLRVTLHRLNYNNREVIEGAARAALTRRRRRVLTQERRVSVSQGEALVSGDGEGRQQVEPFVQQRLEAGGGRVGRMEQVINLLTGGMESRH